MGPPYSQHGILWQARGEPQYLETFRAGADPGSILSHLCLGPPRDRDLGRLDLGSAGFWEQDYEWGVRVSRPLAHAGGVLYGTELGSVTLERVGLFCSPTKHSTHTQVWVMQQNGCHLTYKENLKSVSQGIKALWEKHKHTHACCGLGKPEAIKNRLIP
jgi:hypothetical protein